MGLLTTVEDRPTPRCVYNWRIYFMAAVASCASCMIGYDSAFIGTTIALQSFKNEFEFDEMSTSKQDLMNANIVSLYQAGAFFGSFFASPIGHFFGRKVGCVVTAAVFILGAGLMLGTTAERGFGILYAGRVLAGLGVGAGSNIVPMYISELSPPAIRGRLVGVYELGWQIGGLIGFWINYGVSTTMPPSHKQWIIPFAIQLIPSGILFIGAFFLRESPRWLFLRGRREEAIDALCWLRKLAPSDAYIRQEIAMIDAAIEDQRTRVGLGYWQPFKVVGRCRRVQYKLFLGSMFFFWQNGSGINAINYYSPTVFKSVGIRGSNTGMLTTGLYGVEMFDPNIRAIAQACAAGSNWLWNFLISRFTPQMFSTMGYGVYFFFASLTVCAFIFVFLLVPETKGVPLERIDSLFTMKPVWRAHSLVLEDMSHDNFDFSSEAEDNEVVKTKEQHLEIP
ncbi:hypothetical protein KEM56_006427 [Ascosphaera pollenicola]|nr:hypothetical protein KEM56_006427 [Ascosphaera pollenicola]